jgi:hypothetical protein
LGSYYSYGHKSFQACKAIGRQPNFKTIDVNGDFVDDPDNDPGIEMDGNVKKVDDIDAAVYIFNEEVQVCYMIIFVMSTAIHMQCRLPDWHAINLTNTCRRVIVRMLKFYLHFR